MDYYVYKNDQNIGPLPEGEVVSKLRNQQFSPTDLGCRVGDSDWKDLSFFFPLETSAPIATRPSQHQQIVYEPPQMHRQATSQSVNPPVVGLPPQLANKFGGMSDVGKIMMFESGKKSTTTAFLLCLFLGALGVHRFYLGHNGSAAAMLIIWLSSWVLMLLLIGFLTIWITPIWAFIDLFLISSMTRKYNEDLALRMGVFH